MGPDIPEGDWQYQQVLVKLKMHILHNQEKPGETVTKYAGNCVKNAICSFAGDERLETTKIYIDRRVKQTTGNCALCSFKIIEVDLYELASKDNHNISTLRKAGGSTCVLYDNTPSNPLFRRKQCHVSFH